MEPILLYALAIPFFIVALISGVLINSLLKVRLKKGAAELKDIAELPAYLKDLFSAPEKELLDLGFEFSHCQLNEKPFVIPYSKDWLMVYFNKNETTYAALSLSPSPEPSNPCSIEFISIFTDGRRLNTVNGIRHNIIGVLPNSTLLDPYAEDLNKQWERHLKELSALKQQKTCLSQTPAEFVSAYAKILNDYVDELEAKEWIKKLDNNSYQLTLKAAFLTCFKAWPGTFKWETLREKRLKKYKTRNITVRIPAQVETEFFHNRAGQFKGAGKQGRLKVILIFLATLVLFSLSFAFKIDLKTILIFIAVIFFHELGHFCGMRFFGQKDAKILFIPFIGAATTGMDKDIRPHRKIIIYFLGPLPGIILGLMILFSPARENPLLRQIANTLLFLNYFNLLPIIPLDGGQIINLFLARFPGLQVILQALGGILFLLISPLLKHDPVFFILGIFLIIGAIAQWPNAALILKLRRKIKTEKLELSENAILPEIFNLLSAKPFDTMQFERKHITVKFLLENSLITLPSAKTIVFFLMVYIFTFTAPVIIGIGAGVHYLITHKPADLSGFSAQKVLEQRDEQIKLAPAEEELAAKIGFDKEMLLFIKQISRGEIRRLEGYDENYRPVPADGISTEAAHLKNRDIVFSLRFPLSLSGYLIFSTGDSESGMVGVLKNGDQFEILRIMKTNGINYGHNNQDIIAKLQEWNEKYPLEIIGADADWVEIKFKEVPQELKTFVTDVYAFCPDSIIQGAGSPDALEREIIKNKRLFLWWD